MKKIRIALTVTALTVATFAVSAPARAESHGSGHDNEGKTVVYTLDDSNHGNPEGVAWDGRFFYVGATGDGTIYRGSLADHTVHTLIPGAAGRSSVGLKTFKGKLYVAGGATGKIFVYDLNEPDAVPLQFDTGLGGFLNDLVVTGNGDVFVTDSFRQTLWHIGADQVKAGGLVDPISVAEIPYTAQQFNLNGLVAFRGGREILVVNSADGKLYRIRFNGTGGHTTTQVDAPDLTGGDGMIVDRGRLVVVRGGVPNLTVLKLNDGRSRARTTDVITDPTLRGPSTVAAARHRYLVVNADFATGTHPFTVSGLSADRDHD
jgi:hypothetical protein